jgi:hypothetical protein
LSSLYLSACLLIVSVVSIYFAIKYAMLCSSCLERERVLASEIESRSKFDKEMAKSITTGRGLIRDMRSRSGLQDGGGEGGSS